MKTSVVTSKKATEHYNEIKQKHEEIIKELNAHTLKVQAYKENQKLEAEGKKASDMEAHKENQKNIQKQQELEIKRMTLKSLN